MKTPLDCIMERENNPKMIGEYVSLNDAECLLVMLTTLAN